MSSRRWALVFLGMALLCALWMLLRPAPGGRIGVWQDNILLYTIDPAAVTEDRELTLRYPAGSSTVRVSREGVEIVRADCPNGDCVRRGVLRPGGSPIVCLPERIVIRYFSDDAAPDAVSGRGSAP